MFNISSSSLSFLLAVPLNFHPADLDFSNYGGVATPQQDDNHTPARYVRTNKAWTHQRVSARQRCMHNATANNAMGQQHRHPLNPQPTRSQSTDASGDVPHPPLSR